MPPNNPAAYQNPYLGGQFDYLREQPAYASVPNAFTPPAAPASPLLPAAPMRMPAQPDEIMPSVPMGTAQPQAQPQLPQDPQQAGGSKMTPDQFRMLMSQFRPGLGVGESIAPSMSMLLSGLAFGLMNKGK